MLRKKTILFSLLVISFFSVIATLLTTRWGIGIRPDSASYLDAARNLLAGHGLTVSFQSPDPIPLLWFAPAYSVLLALASSIFGDPLHAGFWLQTVFLVGSIFLTGQAVYRCTGGSTAATIAGAALMASAPDILFYHAFILTEPAFIFFALLSWLLLDRYLETNSRRSLILAALMTLTAFMFRYSGAGLVGASGLAILLFSRQRIIRRVLDGLLFGAISVLPVLVWMRWIAMQSTIGGGRVVIFHPITLRKLGLGAFTISRWVLPEDMMRRATDMRDPIAALAAALIVTLIALTTIRVIRYYKLMSLAALRRVASKAHPLAALLTLFAVGYLAFLIFSISFIDAYTYLEKRQLLPVHLAAIIVGTYVTYETVQRLPQGNRLRRGLMAGIAVLLFSYVAQGTLQAVSFYNDGVEFTDATWRQSALIAFINEQPPETLIYTNNPEAVYLITGRNSVRVPAVYDFATLRTNTHLDDDVQAMGAALQGGGYIVMFNDKDRPHIITAAALMEKLPLAVVMSDASGAIYRVGG